MSTDLILGRTGRDWSCGGAAAAPAPTPQGERLPEVPRLAESVRAEMARTASTAIRMRRAGRLPDVDWRAFGTLHRRWLTLSDARRGRWREADSPLLLKLREDCRGFAGRFKVLADLAKPGSTALVPAGGSPAPQPSSLHPWHVALGAALALAGTGLLAKARGKLTGGRAAWLNTST